jgi:hypothetical protein
MNKENLVAILSLIGGLFCIICAILDLDFFMNHRKAKLFVTLLSRTGARIFYILLGLFLCFIAVKLLL